jgi:hypothetical protein
MARIRRPAFEGFVEEMLEALLDRLVVGLLVLIGPLALYVSPTLQALLYRLVI